MQVDIHPCTSKGKALSEDEFVDKPEQLVRFPARTKLKSSHSCFDTQINGSDA